MNRRDFEDADRIMRAFPLLTTGFVVLSALDWNGGLLLGEKPQVWAIVTLSLLSWFLFESAIRVGYLGFMSDRLGAPHPPRGMVAIAREYFGRRLFLFMFLQLLYRLCLEVVGALARASLGAMEMGAESQRYVLIHSGPFFLIPLGGLVYFFDFYILVLLLTGREPLEHLMQRLVAALGNPRIHGIVAHASCYGGLATLGFLVQLGVELSIKHAWHRPELVGVGLVLTVAIQAAMTWTLLAGMSRYHKQRALGCAHLSPWIGEGHSGPEE